MAKTKLAILPFLCCGEIVKNSNGKYSKCHFMKERRISLKVHNQDQLNIFYLETKSTVQFYFAVFNCFATINCPLLLVLHNYSGFTAKLSFRFYLQKITNNIKLRMACHFLTGLTDQIIDSLLVTDISIL